MGTSTLRLIVLAVLSAGALLAQDLTGTWQGTINPPDGKDLRGVFQISKAGDATKCVFYTIDQSPIPFACSVAQAGGMVKIAVPARGGSYEGKLDAGGGDLFGTWTNAGIAMTLILQRVKEGVVAWPIPEAPAKPKAMAADADPAFDVASIKPSDPGQRGRLFQSPGREFRASNASGSVLIEWSMGFHARQILGAPAWFEVDKYNIVGTPDLPGIPSQAQWKAMVMKLLAERFQLKFHHENKEMPVYILEVAKGGTKMVPSADQSIRGSLLFHGSDLPARSVTMADFAAALGRAVLDRPVVDQTGLEGKWDFHLVWTRQGNEMSSLGAPPVSVANFSADGTPDLATAIQEQLGLKLSTGKAVIDVIVIDRVEKPSGN